MTQDKMFFWARKLFQIATGTLVSTCFQNWFIAISGPHQKQALRDTKLLSNYYKANPNGEKPTWSSWKLPRCKTSGKIVNIIWSPFIWPLSGAFEQDFWPCGWEFRPPKIFKNLSYNNVGAEIISKYFKTCLRTQPMLRVIARGNLFWCFEKNTMKRGVGLSEQRYCNVTKRDDNS